jgi:hypothetical protein
MDKDLNAALDAIAFRHRSRHRARAAHASARFTRHDARDANDDEPPARARRPSRARDETAREDDDDGARAR